MDHPQPAEGPVPSCIYLVRHGETAWSLSGRHTGRTDIALTGRGEDQARAIRPIMASVPFDRVFVSPSGRARETCDLAGLGAACEVEPDLAEWDYGDYEGRLSLDIRAERPAWTVYRDGCPGGESPDDVTHRADRLIARLRALHGTVALFSHGQIGSSLAMRWIGLPIVHGQHFMLGPASLAILATNPSHPDMPLISGWNVAAPVPRLQVVASMDARPVFCEP